MAKITEGLLEKLKFKKKRVPKWLALSNGADDDVKNVYEWVRYNPNEILGFEYMTQNSWDVKNDNWVVFVGEEQYEIKNADTLEEIVNLHDRLEVLILGKNKKR